MALWAQLGMQSAAPFSVIGALALRFAAIAAMTAVLLRRLLAREAYRRGTLILPSARQWRWCTRRIGAATLTLGGNPIAYGDEAKHFKLIGTTGTGKSTAIRELLAGALARGDRAVISDPDASYLTRFVDRYRGDVILNPFEPHSHQWDLFGELGQPYDVEQLAGALIASSEDASTQEWRAYARTFVSAVIGRCLSDGCRDLSELWRLLAVAPPEQLRALVADTPAQPFLEPDNARMFASIRAVATSAIGALKYIKTQRAAALSVRNWVRSDRGVLFIPYRAAQIAALRSMIATWLGLAIFEAMSQTEGRDQRLWFVVDELDALGAIDGLKDALARLRKFGGRCVLGFQSIAQVSSTYGQGEAQTIVENCGNTLILRCAGSEHGGTSQFASRLIGERELLRRQISRAHDRAGLLNSHAAHRSTQISDQRVIELAVLASEIEQLPDLNGYLKTASSHCWRHISLRGSAAR